MAGKIRHSRNETDAILRAWWSRGHCGRLLAKHPGAVAELQAIIAAAEEQVNAKKTVEARYPMTAQEIAFANYQSKIAFDLEIREHDPRFANVEVDDGLVAALRGGIAGRLGDDELEELVGYRIEWFRYRGNTDAGSSEWRKLAIGLCVSEYEALARKVERDEGNFTGQPEHPLKTPPLMVVWHEAQSSPGSLRAVYGRLSVGKGLFERCSCLVGAAMYPTCRCGLSCAAGHNAIRAAQVPIVSSHSKCTAPVGSPDPAVSTGFVH